MTINPYGVGMGDRIKDALAEGPKLASELPGPRYMLPDRIVSLNAYWKKIGSHWRIRGERVEAWTGTMFERTVRYSLVMEGVGDGHASDQSIRRP